MEREGAEQRQAARTAFEAWVELAAGDERHLGRSCDLSVGGLGVSLDGPLPKPGERLGSEFALPGMLLPLLVAARVAWSDPQTGRLGLAFESLDAGVAEILQSAVAGRFRSG
jgi:hypothetical protein